VIIFSKAALKSAIVRPLIDKVEQRLNLFLKHRDAQVELG
jgi:hypothetical protein